MANWAKIKEWVNENAPMLANVYENKYVGMAWDHFASLPAKQQKQTLFGVIGGFFTIVVGFLLFSYLSLWSYSSRAKESYAMANMLQQYQKNRRDKSAQLAHLERSSQLASPGQFREHLLQQGRAASISQRMMQVEEKPEGGDESTGRDVRMRQATVILEKVNLTQLKGFLNNVEFGPYQLGVSSIKITNDDKIRGYMKVELGVVAYLFETSEEVGVGGGG